MTIDHRILLQGRPRTVSTGEGIGHAFSSIGQMLRQKREEERQRPIQEALQKQRGLELEKAELELAEKKRLMADSIYRANAADRARLHQQGVDAGGDFSAIIGNLKEAREKNIAQGLPTRLIDAALDKYKTGQADVAGQTFVNAAQQQRMSRFVLDKDQYGLKEGDNITYMRRGVDKNTGQAAFFDEISSDEIPQSRIRAADEYLTPNALKLRHQEAVDESRKRRDISVKQEEARAEKEKRIVAQKEEIRLRSQARNTKRMLIEDVLTSLRKEDLSTGYGAKLKNQLARVLPNIDVTDLGKVDAALTQLTVEQLQNFKGPTTDFEFGKSENIGGTITDPKAAIEAKLALNQRTAWANDQYDKELRKWMSSGKDPADFQFDFWDADGTGNDFGSQPFSRGGKPLNAKDGKVYSYREIYKSAAHNNMSIQEFTKRIYGKGS